MQACFLFNIIFYFFDYSCGHTADHAVVRHVLCHNCTCRHNDIIADANAGQDGDIAADSYVITDVNRFGNAQVFPATHGR